MKKESNNNKSWDFTKELGNIYDEMLQEKFDFKKVFGDDEDEDGDEEEEDCGEEEEEEERRKKKDACYKKVKSRYPIWPSAYASGALVKCRKVGAKNWGNSKK